MTHIDISTKLQHLTPSMKNEVNDFIDFLLTKQNAKTPHRKPIFGCAKGKFVMSNDFDEPLEDLKEYMG
jgi:hypothetical protein